MQYKVLRPIELAGKLYLPEPAVGTPPLQKAKSAANGLDIPVDASGVIELTEAQAAAMTLGQVQALPQAQAPEKPATKTKK